MDEFGWFIVRTIILSLFAGLAGASIIRNPRALIALGLLAPLVPIFLFNKRDVLMMIDDVASGKGVEEGIVYFIAAYVLILVPLFLGGLTAQLFISRDWKSRAQR